MRDDKRKATRHLIQIKGKLVPGGGLPTRECTVIDISDTGAKLAVDAPHEIPDDFTILLSAHGHPYRRCHLVWRSAAHVGVAFYDRLPAIAEHQASASR
jgi:hypothetical protein